MNLLLAIICSSLPSKKETIRCNLLSRVYLQFGAFFFYPPFLTLYFESLIWAGLKLYHLCFQNSMGQIFCVINSSFNFRDIWIFGQICTGCKNNKSPPPPKPQQTKPHTEILQIQIMAINYYNMPTWGPKCFLPCIQLSSLWDVINQNSASIIIFYDYFIFLAKHMCCYLKPY